MNDNLATNMDPLVRWLLALESPLFIHHSPEIIRQTVGFGNRAVRLDTNSVRTLFTHEAILRPIRVSPNRVRYLFEAEERRTGRAGPAGRAGADASPLLRRAFLESSQKPRCSAAKEGMRSGVERTTRGSQTN